jgi:beta-galactosidase
MPTPPISRRRFLETAAVAAAGLPVPFRSRPFRVRGRSGGALHAACLSAHRLNFNLNWRFVREDVAGAEAPAFDDSQWTTVSTPHSFNDVDSFRKIISHSGGDLGTYKGIAWYRKHFKLPASYFGRKIFSNSRACARRATSS